MTAVLDIAYIDGDNRRRYILPWVNFLNATAIDSDYPTNAHLAEWNGRKVYGKFEVEFDSEEDLVLFVLRWS